MSTFFPLYKKKNIKEYGVVVVVGRYYLGIRQGIKKGGMTNPPLSTQHK